MHTDCLAQPPWMAVPNCTPSTRATHCLPRALPLLSYAAVRPGLDGSPYLYTLNMSCPQELWGDLEAAFQRGVESFRCGSAQCIGS